MITREQRILYLDGKGKDRTPEEETELQSYFHEDAERPKTMREIIESHKRMTHEDLIADPNVLSLCQLLGTIVSSLDPADVVVALACIFGSIAFDAEMQGALQMHPRLTITATFEERLELFGVHAKIAYEGVKAYVKAEQPYTDGRKPS